MRKHFLFKRIGLIIAIAVSLETGFAVPPGFTFNVVLNDNSKINETDLNNTTVPDDHTFGKVAFITDDSQIVSYNFKKHFIDRSSPSLVYQANFTTHRLASITIKKELTEPFVHDIQKFIDKGMEAAEILGGNVIAFESSSGNASWDSPLATFDTYQGLSNTESVTFNVYEQSIDCSTTTIPTGGVFFESYGVLNHIYQHQAYNLPISDFQYSDYESESTESAWRAVDQRIRELQ